MCIVPKRYAIIILEVSFYHREIDNVQITEFQVSLNFGRPKKKKEPKKKQKKRRDKARRDNPLEGKKKLVCHFDFCESSCLSYLLTLKSAEIRQKRMRQKLSKVDPCSVILFLSLFFFFFFFWFVKRAWPLKLDPSTLGERGNFSKRLMAID